MGEEFIRRIMVLGWVPSLGPRLLLDDMEDLFKWTQVSGAGDSVFEKSASVAYNGSASLHMKTRTTGAAENDEIGGYRKLYQRPGKRYRVELLWMPDAAVGAKYTDFQLIVYDGTNENIIKLRYETLEWLWYYWNSAGGWSIVSSGSQTLAVDQFHRLSFDVDLASGKYIKMVSDAMEKDLSGFSFEQSASPAGEEMELRIGIIAGATPPGEIYIDDVLVMEI